MNFNYSKTVLTLSSSLSTNQSSRTFSFTSKTLYKVLKKTCCYFILNNNYFLLKKS